MQVYIYVYKCELATICFNLNVFTFQRPCDHQTLPYTLAPPLSAGDCVQPHHRRLDIWVTLFRSASHTCAWREFVCVLRRTKSTSGTSTLKLCFRLFQLFAYVVLFVHYIGMFRFR